LFLPDIVVSLSMGGGQVNIWQNDGSSIILPGEQSGIAPQIGIDRAARMVKSWRHAGQPMVVMHVKQPKITRTKKRHGEY
jgi:hypothetical protein